MNEANKKVLEETRVHFKAIMGLVREALKNAESPEEINFWEYMGAAAEEYGLE